MGGVVAGGGSVTSLVGVGVGTKTTVGRLVAVGLGVLVQVGATVSDGLGVPVAVGLAVRVAGTTVGDGGFSGASA